MSVIHILKDGSIVKDISGRVVRLEDAGAIYQLLHNINTGQIKKEVFTKCKKLKAVR